MSKFITLERLGDFADKIKELFAKKTDLPTKTSDLTNDSNFPVDANYVHTDNNYTTDEKNKLAIAATLTDGKLTESQIPDKVVCVGSDGLISSSQLPSYVDDVLEYENKSSFPESGESGKIYVALDSNLTYRWGGTEYVEISKSLALGETDSTAYPGSAGKALEQNKVDKVDGKQLSTEDFTTTLKTKLESLSNYDDSNVISLIGEKQAISNLVTAFQTTPDDTHYPSEKLVKDSLDAKSSVKIRRFTITT